jgi:hypothetical protein
MDMIRIRVALTLLVCVFVTLGAPAVAAPVDEASWTTTAEAMPVFLDFNR